MNEIGNKIRQTREKRGLSQENMATELGITQPSYARLEKDDNRLSITRIANIATILKISVSELINNEEKVIDNQNGENSNTYSNHVFQTGKDHIQTLKDEINFLRNLINKEKR